VVKGKLNDTLTIKLRHVKPKLAFDLFTVENSPFLSDGTPNGPSLVAISAWPGISPTFRPTPPEMRP
jgi:hypothetical protein